jgi:hypothetical protein
MPTLHPGGFTLGIPFGRNALVVPTTLCIFILSFTSGTHTNAASEIEKPLQFEQRVNSDFDKTLSNNQSIPFEEQGIC